MGAVILGCGTAVTTGDWEKLAASTGSELHEIPATPGRSDVDPVLKPGRLIVHGTDADLAAVVLRVLRKERLGEVTVGYVPVDWRHSAVARKWGLPEQTVDVALTGSVHSEPLVRDDAGGVLLGHGVLPAVRGTVYCDDALALRGHARRIEVTPDPAGVHVRVVHLLRTHTFTGRAVQFGCDKTVPVRDGVPYARPMTRWTWYRHTEDLRVIR